MPLKVDESTLQKLALYLSRQQHEQYSTVISFPLARLPTELRLRIYEFAFAYPAQTVHLDKLSEWQSWAYEFSLRLGDCTFYPHGLKRIPSDLQNEALAVAYQRTIFKATQMDQIVRLYGSLGRVGLENLETLHLDWTATEDPDFVHPTTLEYQDNLALQVVSLLRFLKKLRHLKIQLNGYAFAYAYLSARHRRLKVPNEDFTDNVRLSYRMWDFHNTQGQLIRTADLKLGSLLEIPGMRSLWKVAEFKFVDWLWLDIAQCDPVFKALATVRGLTSFELKQSPNLPSGLDPRIADWLNREVTKPMEEGLGGETTDDI